MDPITSLHARPKAWLHHSVLANHDRVAMNIVAPRMLEPAKWSILKAPRSSSEQQVERIICRIAL